VRRSSRVAHAMISTTNIIEVGVDPNGTVPRIIQLGDFCVGDSYSTDLISTTPNNNNYYSVDVMWYRFSSCTVTYDLHDNRDL